MTTDALHLFAPADRIAATIRFYREFLARAPDTDDAFAVGGRTLAIVPGRADAAQRATGLAFHVHGLWPLLAHLVAGGFLSAEAVPARSSRGDEVAIADPAGNLIRLINIDD